MTHDSSHFFLLAARHYLKALQDDAQATQEFFSQLVGAAPRLARQEWPARQALIGDPLGLAEYIVAQDAEIQRLMALADQRDDERNNHLRPPEVPEHIRAYVQRAIADALRGSAPDQIIKEGA